jgi:2-phosphoglycerate kinase
MAFDGTERPVGPLAWQVLLVGGSSGTGKSVLAQRLARRFGVALTQVDDLRLALQRSTTPEALPDLHYFLATPAVWQRPAEELRDRLIAVGRVVSRAAEAVVEHHLDTPYPLILEGDGIVPELAARAASLAQATGRVRSVFLVEPAEHDILASMTERGRGFEQHAAAEQRTQARMNWLYGEWLKDECRRLGLPTLSTRPRDTLLARVVAAIDGAAPREAE